MVYYGLLTESMFRSWVKFITAEMHVAEPPFTVVASSSSSSSPAAASSSAAAASSSSSTAPRVTGEGAHCMTVNSDILADRIVRSWLNLGTED